MGNGIKYELYPLYKDYETNPDYNNILDSIVRWKEYDTSIEKSFYQAIKLFFIASTLDESRSISFDFMRDTIYDIIKEYILKYNNTPCTQFIESVLKYNKDKSSINEYIFSNLVDFIKNIFSTKRVEKNNQIISKRFNITNIQSYLDTFDATVTSLPKYTLLMFKICDYVDTYALKVEDKVTLAIEETVYLITTSKQLYENNNFLSNDIIPYIIKYTCLVYFKSKYPEEFNLQYCSAAICKSGYLPPFVISAIHVDDNVFKKINVIVGNNTNISDYTLRFSYHQIISIYLSKYDLNNKDDFLQFICICGNCSGNYDIPFFIFSPILYYSLLSDQWVNFGCTIKGIISSLVYSNPRCSAYTKELITESAKEAIKAIKYFYPESDRATYVCRELDRMVEQSMYIKRIPEPSIPTRESNEILSNMEILCESMSCEIPNFNSITIKQLKENHEFIPYMIHFSNTYPQLMDPYTLKTKLQSLKESIVTYNKDTGFLSEAVNLKSSITLSLDSFIVHESSPIEYVSEEDVYNEGIDSIINEMAKSSYDISLMKDIYSFMEEYDEDEEEQKEEPKEPSLKDKIVAHMTANANNLKNDLLNKVKKVLDDPGEAYEQVANKLKSSIQKASDTIVSIGSLGNKEREDKIRHSIIPKLRTALNIVLGASLIYYKPLLFVLFALVKITNSAQTSQQARLAIKDELESQVELIDKKIAYFDRNDDFKNQKSLLTLKKSYQREIFSIDKHIKKNKDK